MSSSIENLVSILHQAHCDNAERVHFAQARRGRRVSTMPTTSFVYEFFIYNSIYQYDWGTTVEKQLLHPWPRDEEMTETQQQNRLEKFLRDKCRQDDSILSRAFQPLLYVDISDDEWTRITPDSRVTAEDGDRFFTKIRALQSIFRDSSSPDSIEPSRQIFKLISDCRYFIFLVRNNIFHGSKHIGEIYEPKQRQRLELYDLFIKCLTSLFFLAFGKTPVASDYVQVPITQHVGSSIINCEQSDVLEGVVSGVFKPEDSRLILKLSQISHSHETPPDKATMFYPSAGIDIITPLIIALPYCREFCFYERSMDGRLDIIVKNIKRYLGVQNPFVERLEREDTISFEVDDVPRIVRWVHKDNMHFLDHDGILAYYFHRGDSWGEGGSGQKWDSDIFPDLLQKMSFGIPCHFVTDGKPGGLLPELEKRSNQLLLPRFSFRNRISDKMYYYATID